MCKVKGHGAAPAPPLPVDTPRVDAVSKSSVMETVPGTLGGGGGEEQTIRGPQSEQSVPRTQELNSLPGPPSSHQPSEEYLQVSSQVVQSVPEDKTDPEVDSGGDDDDNESASTGGGDGDAVVAHWVWPPSQPLNGSGWQKPPD